MAGIFPASGDGGLPPATGQTYPTHAYPPVKPPLDTTALYYGNGCDARIRPEVINSVISEIEATVDGVGLAYQSGLLTNLFLAVQYVTQKGIPRYAVLSGGPNTYTGAVTPPVLAYNDGMTMTVLPNVNNQGAVSVNFNGVGLVPVLRNDGQQMQSKDWLAYVPQIICFYHGNWYVPYMLPSQVPLLVTNLDVWIRTDGSDTTGDGTANTPQAAFRTIQFAWDTVSARYAATPKTVINLRLGIPGTYAGAMFSSYGGTLYVWGDSSGAAPDNYKIQGVPVSGPTTAALAFGAITTCGVTGVCCLIDQPYPVYQMGISLLNGSTGIINRCNFQANISNSNAGFLQAISNAWLYTRGTMIFRGQNNTIGTGLAATQEAGLGPATSTDPPIMTFQDVVLGAGCFVTATSSMTIGGMGATVSNSNTHGPRYSVSGNAILYLGGQTAPGDTAGSTAYNGQVVP